MKKNSEFVKGFLCCAAIMLKSHGDETPIRDALHCIGSWNPNDIDDSDREALEGNGYRGHWDNRNTERDRELWGKDPEAMAQYAEMKAAERCGIPYPKDSK